MHHQFQDGIVMKHAFGASLRELAVLVDIYVVGQKTYIYIYTHT